MRNAAKKTGRADALPTQTRISAPVLTPEGKAMLEARIRRLRTDVMPELALAMQDRDRDGRDALEYARVALEHHRLVETLAHAQVANEAAGEGGDSVGLGDEVEIRFADGVVERCLIVHPVEAPLDDHRVSAESPLGKAMIGARPGQEVMVQAPGHPYRCRLVRWARKRSPRRLIAEVASN